MSPDGTRVLVGAHGYNDTGAAFLYTAPSGQWVTAGAMLSTPAELSGLTGSSVAITNTSYAVGSANATTEVTLTTSHMARSRCLACCHKVSSFRDTSPLPESIKRLNNGDMAFEQNGQITVVTPTISASSASGLAPSLTIALMLMPLSYHRLSRNKLGLIQLS